MTSPLATTVLTGGFGHQGDGVASYAAAADRSGKVVCTFCAGERRETHDTDS